MQPATSCVGCLPVETGVKLILFYNLMQNAYCCAMAVGNVVLRLPTLGYGTSMTAQILTAAWCLAGIPIVVVALWGVFHRIEPFVRFYFYYMVTSILIDVGSLVNLLVIQDSCATLTIDHAHGRAFACMIARSTNMVVLVFILAVSLYALYMVWSFMQDLTDGGSAAAIADLLYGKDNMLKMRNHRAFGRSLDADAVYDSIRMPSAAKFSESYSPHGSDQRQYV